MSRFAFNSSRYNEVIDICKVIADVRSFMTAEQREKMSKPDATMYERIKKDVPNYINND